MIDRKDKAGCGGNSDRRRGPGYKLLSEIMTEVEKIVIDFKIIMVDLEVWGSLCRKSVLPSSL